MSQLPLTFKNESSVCPTCGHKTVVYKFGLNRGLIAFLRKLAAAGRPVTLGELSMTAGQYTNHALIRHWGLAKMLEPENEIEKRKGGKWTVTDEGRDFLRGVTQVPKHIFVANNKIVEYGIHHVGIVEVEEGYKYRGDYREQARNALRR